jgi:hypothetical protein
VCCLGVIMYGTLVWWVSLVGTGVLWDILGGLLFDSLSPCKFTWCFLVLAIPMVGFWAVS